MADLEQQLQQAVSTASESGDALYLQGGGSETAQFGRHCEGRVLELSLPRDGVWRMDARSISHAQLPGVLQDKGVSRCVAEVDRHAPAEGVVALLGAVNTRPGLRLEVRYLSNE